MVVSEDPDRDIFFVRTASTAPCSHSMHTEALSESLANSHPTFFVCVRSQMERRGKFPVHILLVGLLPDQHHLHSSPALLCSPGPGRCWLWALHCCVAQGQGGAGCGLSEYLSLDHLTYHSPPLSEVVKLHTLLVIRGLICFVSIFGNAMEVLLHQHQGGKEVRS